VQTCALPISHELEASEVRADQKRPATARASLLHERLALDRDVEQLVASAHEVKTIENGRGEGGQLAKALTGGGLVSEHAAQILAGAPVRAGGEGEEIRGDEVGHAPRQRASHVERDENPYPEQRRAAAPARERPV